MSYVSQKEKIFGLKDPDNPDCTPPTSKRSDHRLKRFFSTSDERAWNVCEAVRYRHLYDLMSGSQTCLAADQCHRYVPLEDLIRILMADKDAYIRELEEKLRKCCGDLENQQRKREDNEMANNQGGKGGDNEVQEEVAALTQELNKSRDMLRQAMHKLQNIDEIVNENKKLYCKLRCSEERIKYLEERKKILERELTDLRSKSQIQMDLERAQEMLSEVNQKKEDSLDMDEKVLQVLSLERDELQEKVKKLEKELEESKKKETEIETLKNQSQTSLMTLEEMAKENECYKKKLASMKCLEKQIQELKKQGRALADKYKREAQKAAEQMRRMCQITQELQCLREERDSLRRRVDELSNYECQYKELKRKLQRVEAVIAENEMLNLKLAALSKMEEENEYLKCKLNQIQETEINAAEDKEKVLQLQCAVAEQEEQIKDLLCQIERLTSGRTDEELERLKCELYDKNSKLKLCEEQLAEIPMLEAEIDELRQKLQCCCRDFVEKKTHGKSLQKLEVRFPTSTRELSANYKTQTSQTSSMAKGKCEDKIGLTGSKSCQEILKRRGELAGSKQNVSCGKREGMSCEEVQCLLQSSKEIISCVLEDMVEHQKEMEELEMCNRAMKEEIEMLKGRVGGSGKNEILQELCHCRKSLEEKQTESTKGKEQRPCGEKEGEMDVETLKDLNRQMKSELEAAVGGLKEIANLEKLLEMERSARCKAESMLKKMGGETDPSEFPEKRFEGIAPEDPEFDCCKILQKETDDLKLQIIELNKLTEELKKENDLLRELQQPCPDFSKELDEKCALENLLSLLQAELDAFKGQKLSDECEALRNELKRVMEQNCQLKALVDCYRQRLDLEKKSTELAKEGEKPETKNLTEDRPSSPLVKESWEKSSELPQAAAKEVEMVQQKNIELQGELDRLKNLLAAKDAELAQQGSPDLQAELDRLKKQLASKDAELAQKGSPDLQAELDRMKKLLAAKDAELAQKGSPDLQAELDQLKKQLASKDAELAQQKKNCDDLLQARAEEMKAMEAKIKSPPPKTGPDPDDLLRQLEQLKAENAEKMKKLMDQHEKELANREKACNDNIAAMKAGYETDIRKLAERHKQSIMRLQGLHEDEVQELNTNYETQMAQSEAAINDIAKGSAAKLRQMAQDHDLEMKKMREELSRSKDELDGSMAKLKAKHSRELRNMKKSSSKRLSLIKGKYEKDKQASDAELAGLKQKLQGEVCDCKSAKKKPKKPRDPTCPLDFNEVLEKILEKGLDCLTFNEIALVHRRACCALEGIVMNSNVIPTLEPPVGDGCPHTPLLEADKQQLLQRIFILEKEIAMKQKQTQEAILSMEVSIKKERCRLRELRNSLQNEQQKNYQLESLLSSQTKIHSDLRKERDQLGNQASLHQSLCLEKSKQLDQEKKDKKYLEDEVDKLKTKVKQLCLALDLEKGNSECKQRREMEQIQVLQMKLEQSANQERRLNMQLQSEAKHRIQLQCQLQALKQSFKQMVSLPEVEKDTVVPESPLDIKSAKEKQNFDQIKERKCKSKSKSRRKNKK